MLLVWDNVVPTGILRKFKNPDEIRVKHYPVHPILFPSQLTEEEALYFLGKALILNQDDHDLLVPRGTTGELLIPIEEEFECYGNTKQTLESCMVEPSFFPKTSESGYKRLFIKLNS